MKKRFFDRKGKSIVAILTSLVLVATLVISLPGVKAWTDDLPNFVTNSSQTNPGTVEVWTAATNGPVTSGNISVGQLFLASINDYSPWVLNGILNYATVVSTDGDDTLYRFTKNANFTCSGPNVLFTPGAASGDSDGKGGDGLTEAQRAWLEAYGKKHDHAHNGDTGGFVWEMTNPTTEFSDGEWIYRCPDCGYIHRTSGGDAYDFFNDSFTKRLRVAQDGQTITIEAGQWVSINREVVNEMKKRQNDITLEIIYKSNGVLGTLTIPRGTDLSVIPDADYSGFDFIALCLNIAPVAKYS